jgi:hypothetical protein
MCENKIVASTPMAIMRFQAAISTLKIAVSLRLKPSSDMKPLFFYGFKQNEKWDESYSEECEMSSETRIALPVEKSPQVVWSRNSKFIGVYIQY